MNYRYGVYGVWCLEERQFCSGTIGNLEHAERELPLWQSGERADVDPTQYHYEIRRVDSSKEIQ